MGNFQKALTQQQLTRQLNQQYFIDNYQYLVNRSTGELFTLEKYITNSQIESKQVLNAIQEYRRNKCSSISTLKTYYHHQNMAYCSQQKNFYFIFHDDGKNTLEKQYILRKSNKQSFSNDEILAVTQTMLVGVREYHVKFGRIMHNFSLECVCSDSKSQKLYVRDPWLISYNDNQYKEQWQSSMHTIYPSPQKLQCLTSDVHQIVNQLYSNYYTIGIIGLQLYYMQNMSDLYKKKSIDTLLLNNTLRNVKDEYLRNGLQILLQNNPIGRNKIFDYWRINTESIRTLNNTNYINQDSSLRLSHKNPLEKIQLTSRQSNVIQTTRNMARSYVNDNKIFNFKTNASPQNYYDKMSPRQPTYYYPNHIQFKHYDKPIVSFISPNKKKPLISNLHFKSNSYEGNMKQIKKIHQEIPFKREIVRRLATKSCSTTLPQSYNNSINNSFIKQKWENSEIKFNQSIHQNKMQKKFNIIKIQPQNIFYANTNSQIITYHKQPYYHQHSYQYKENKCQNCRKQNMKAVPNNYQVIKQIRQKANKLTPKVKQIQNDQKKQPIKPIKTTDAINLPMKIVYNQKHYSKLRETQFSQEEENQNISGSLQFKLLKQTNQGSKAIMKQLQQDEVLSQFHQQMDHVIEEPISATLIKQETDKYNEGIFSFKEMPIQQQSQINQINNYLIKTKNLNQSKQSKVIVEVNEQTPQGSEQSIKGAQEFVVQEYQTGSRYEGFKVNGTRNGRGKFYYQDGGHYQGEWKNNKMHGWGKLYYEGGKLAYQGHWANDEFHGYGKVYNDNPNILRQPFDYSNFDLLGDYWQFYEGTLVSDTKEGRGKIKITNQQIFEGDFHCDRIQGFGKFITVDGNIIQGIWRDSKLIKIIN